MTKVRTRRRWLWLGLVPALLLGGFLGVRALLQPERLSAFLLRQASESTGLEITLGEPADIGFWPDLHLELSGLSAALPGDPSPVLRSEQVDAVLPWSALGSETLELRSLRLHRPEIDVAAVQRWLDAREVGDRSKSLRLPQLDAALEVQQGRIVGESWAIADLTLQLPAFRIGEPTTLALAGALVRKAKAELPFDLRIAATPQQDGGEFRLDPLTLSAHTAGMDAPWLQLTGSLAWRPATRLAFLLDGTMPRWPAAWTALPLPAATDEGVQLSFEFGGKPDLEGALSLHIARGDDAIDGALQLGALLAWAGDAHAGPLPPLRGTIDAANLQFGGMILRGVHVSVEDDPIASPEPDATP